MSRRAFFAFLALAPGSVFAQQIIDWSVNSTGPTGFSIGGTSGGSPMFELRQGGSGEGAEVQGYQDLTNGFGRSKTSADWTGFYAFHTNSIVNPQSFEKIKLASLSGAPVSLTCILDYSFTVTGNGRTDYKEWDLGNDNRWRARIDYSVQQQGTPEIHSWWGTYGPTRGFRSKDGISIRSTGQNSMQMYFTRKFNLDPLTLSTELLTARNFLMETQSGAPNGPSIIQLFGEYKARYRIQPADAYVIGQNGYDQHTESALDRIEGPLRVDYGVKKNYTVYTTRAFSTDKRIYLKPVFADPRISVSMASYITLPAGQKSKLVGLQAFWNGNPGEETPVNIQIMAVMDGKMTPLLIRVTPVPLKNLIVPATIHGGQTAIGTVVMGNGFDGNVTLIENSDVLTITPNQFMTQGSMGQFQIATSPVTANNTVPIKLTYETYSITKTTVVVPASTLNKVEFLPITTQGGNPVTVKSTLAKAAPLGGARVSLTSSSTAVPLPPSMLVPAGAVSGTVTVTTNPVFIGQTVTVIAVLNGVTKTGVMVLTP